MPSIYQNGSHLAYDWCNPRVESQIKRYYSESFAIKKNCFLSGLHKRPCMLHASTLWFWILVETIHHGRPSWNLCQSWMRWRLMLVCSMESVKLEKYADDLMCHKFFDCVHLFLTIHAESGIAVIECPEWPSYTRPTKPAADPMTNRTEMCASHATPSPSCFVRQMSIRTELMSDACVRCKQMGSAVKYPFYRFCHKLILIAICLFEF